MSKETYWCDAYSQIKDLHCPDLTAGALSPSIVSVEGPSIEGPCMDTVSMEGPSKKVGHSIDTKEGPSIVSIEA